jgi:hypothetical protein
MYPKPPITRTGKSGWLGHRTARLKSLAVVGAVTLGFAGAAFAAAVPASADPSFGFVAVGSYDAVNPVTQIGGEIITPAVAGSGGAQQNCSFTRPNGSGQGFKALDASFNPSTTLAQLAVPPGAGCLQFSRSSGGPGSGTSAATGPGIKNTAGALVYIPFALDAVTDATGPATATSETTQCLAATTGCTNVVSGIGTITFTTTPTAITTASQFTVANLQTLYGTCANVTVGGVTYNPNTAAAGQTQINLYAPQNGSGTLSFWESSMGVTAVQTCWHQTIAVGPASGIAVEEHDGSALASDPNGIAPISIAKWLAMSNGVVSPDVRHGDVLQSIVVSATAVPPVVSGNLNTAFPIVREVYNVMSFAAVTAGTGNNPVQTGLFSGTGSSLCQSAFTIEEEGFGLLPSGSTPDQCGSTANSLRVQETNNGPS